MNHSDCTKYLGDYVNSNGLIDVRVKKAQGSVIELISICKEAQFSSNQISAMFLLYRSVFLPRLIFNCETWSNQEVELLQKVQLKYLRNMMEVANSTPVAGTFLELGIL